LLPEANLTRVTLLDLRGNNLYGIPATFAGLTNLTSLDLGENDLTRIPIWVGTLTKLKTLGIDGNELESPPASIIEEGVEGVMNFLSRVFYAYATGTLDLENRALSELPVELLTGTGQYGLDPPGALISHLRTLNLNTNAFEQLEAEIADLTALTDLRVSQNELKELPPSVCTLPLLQVLHVEENNLETLPVDLGKLTLLRVLMLAVNKLTFLPETIGVMCALEELVLDYNAINYLPVSLSGLSSIAMLSLQHNDLEVIANVQFNNFVKCRELNLAENKLRRVPEDIEYMTSLTRLQLHSNFFKGLPSGLREEESEEHAGWPIFRGGVGQLTSLTELTLHTNEIEKLPVDLGLITCLKTMPLEANPDLTSPPPEVVVRKHRIIMEYLRQICLCVKTGTRNPTP
ncbi:hypothetical protein T484DRAFT_1805625, partial [Baffinella frigidus]